jgi:nucleotidyltransferase substrate binding protein (TIGR01987 family)
LEHCQPRRIYLFGSRASGEESSNSDFDFAYDAPEFNEHHLILEKINALDTLHEIDIHNLATAEPRFRDRVLETGRVLYSANKKLRAEDSLYNLKRALKTFEEVLTQKSRIDLEQSIINDAKVKRFEYTFEVSWKAIKRYLDYTGIDCSSPRACLKEAFKQALIKDEGIWLEILENRNLTSHIYSQDRVSDVIERMDDFAQAFQRLTSTLETSLAEL